MSLNRRTAAVMACRIAAIWFLTALPGSASAQEDRPLPREVLVGVTEVPPLYVKTADGRWEGLGAELRQAVAQHAGIAYQFKEYRTLGTTLDALGKGEIDAIPSLPAEERLEVSMDFSQSYLMSGLSIAVPAEGALADGTIDAFVSDQLGWRLAQSIRSYAGSVRNSTNVSLLTRSAKIFAPSS